MTFTHLQVRTGYSLMKSTVQIDSLIKRTKELNMTALAITDEHVLYGVIPFYKRCIDEGIKPIIGMIVHIQTDAGSVDTCTLLAKNNRGYEQLAQLSTYIQTNNYETISFESVSTYINEHTICIYHAINPYFTELCNDHMYEKVSEYIDQWKHVVQDDNFYIGIQDHGKSKERTMTNHVRHLYTTTSTQVVALQDVRYVHAHDEEAYHCLQAMDRGELLEESKEKKTVRRRYVRSQEEMEQLFTEVFPEALAATADIARKCDVTFDFNNVHMPAFPVPEDERADTYVRTLCENGLKERYEDVTQVVIDRMNMELQTIRAMGFSDYFLIVADFVAHAKREGIVVGPGRGSAAGSLVAYLLGITNVDPIKHDLLFERFLNPERRTLPDIDIDFSDHRRDEVINYVKEKYGKEKVAQIITFGTFGPRSLIREVGKAIELNEKDMDFVLKQMPLQANASIVTYVKQSKELYSYIEQSQKLQQLFRYASTLEGLPRHTSTHAAGVVISKDPLTTHTPLTIGADGEYITQFAMNELEAVGLLKMDFLGLRNLSLLERLVSMIERTSKKEFDLTEIPVQDEATFKMLSEGRTSGVFQFESAGMTRVLTDLQPTVFDDLVAVNALYRPGPMEYISTFIARKNGKEQVVYPHEDVAPILKKTYGVLIYQEQIIQLAHRIAGLTYAEADVLRRAISKKDLHMMEELKQSFINGCLENEYERNVAEQLFDWIVRFSNYGFNKSHSVAYSTISYQLAYIKAHEPLIFYTCLLSSTNQSEQIARYMKEAEAQGITILPPDINLSFHGYRLEKQGIRMGLLSIKGIGYQIVQEIISVRKNGRFSTIFDFCMRVSTKKVNRKTIETLIRAGTFDSTHKNRMSLLASLEQAFEQAALFKEFHEQPNLLGEDIDLRPQYTNVEDMDLLEKLLEEKELIGRYASSHPLKQFRPELMNEGFIPIKRFDKTMLKREVRTVGIIQSIRKIRTKRGDSMAFVTVADEEGEVDGVIFPNVFRTVSNSLDEQQIVQLSGKVEERNKRTQYVISTIRPFDLHAFQEEKKQGSTLYIKMTKENGEDALEELRDLARSFSGRVPIIVYDEKEKQSYQLSSSYNIEATKLCIDAFKKRFGEENVVHQSNRKQ